MQILPALSQLFDYGKPMNYKSGEILIRNEDVPTNVFLLKSGFVMVYSISDQGNKRIHVLYGPGDCYPLMWAFNQVQTDAYFEALTPTSCLRIPPAELMKRVEANNEFSVALIKQALRQFQYFVNTVDALQRDSAIERVGRMLSLLAERYGQKTKTGIAIPIPLSQSVLAQLTKISRETASRVITKLTKQNILSHSYRQIVITSTDKLRTLSE